MNSFSLFMLGTMGLLWILLPLAIALAGLRKQARWRRAAGAIGGVFMAVGGLGFFGAGFSAYGGLDFLGSHFEWPVGYSTEALSLSSLHVVPLVAPGRIQVYDQNWHFQRGWHVDAGGGGFKIYSADGINIDVVTARTKRHECYSPQGVLLFPENSLGDYAKAPASSEFASVPTHWWLWPFIGPGYSWVVGALGIIMLGLTSGNSRRSSHTPTSAMP